MLPPFHGERMQGYAEMMAEVTREELERWPIGEPFELWPRMREITLEAIMRVVFGPIDTPELKRLREQLRRLTDWMNDPRRLTLLAAAGPRWLSRNSDYKEMMQPVERSVLDEVRRRRERRGARDSDDIASMLAEARYEDGAPMTEQDLRDEIVTLLVDGPTSTLLSWVFERMLRHPAMLARLREEVLAGRGRHLPGRGHQGDDAAMPGRANRGAQAARADGAGRLHDSRRHDGCAMRALGAQPRGHLPPATRVPPRAFHRQTSGHIHVDTVRRRRAPLSGGKLCASTDEAGYTHRAREMDLRPVEPRSEWPVRNAIAFVPHRHALVIATPRPVTQQGLHAPGQERSAA